MLSLFPSPCFITKQDFFRLFLLHLIHDHAGLEVLLTRLVLSILGTRKMEKFCDAMHLSKFCKLQLRSPLPLKRHNKQWSFSDDLHCMGIRICILFSFGVTLAAQRVLVVVWWNFSFQSKAGRSKIEQKFMSNPMTFMTSSSSISLHS